MELRKQRWVLVGLAILVAVAAAWLLASVPCHIKDGTTYCSFHERAEDLYEAYKSLLQW